MLARSAQEDHSRRIETLVQRWLHARQSLIVQMLSLGKEHRRVDDKATLHERVQSFCQALMDYVSAGHFEIYDELLAEAESRGGQSPAEGRTLLARLQPTTDAMIRFNDIYEEADAELLDSLPHELSTLGLELERRFEVEDRMIALLHGGKAPA